ncbi:gonadotropin-releasing hormone II receptor [Eurytemora carolleeae]|uniref:gonadotropin-releasing hormone II receptor n=1 Tax=Eurytemora carolleeae TaxID=1294199 RepID=UPI000C75B369|nr:gonadotropin-releasing hormone II receptor [Eurytemora carolleeae]|eukprot:XP_023331687.1 gonadotropin-releasing hormone II receptor-like [Eurytemora affinis]
METMENSSEFNVTMDLNLTNTNFTLPEDMVFGEAHVYSMIAYSILFIIGFYANSTSLKHFLHVRYIQRKATRINLLFIHLCISDLLVICLEIPISFGWAATVSWWADDVTCRLVVFARIIGFYLSSFILIIVSYDRFNAIVRPISNRLKTKLIKNLLIASYIMAPLCALPQIFRFSKKPHPSLNDYYQCTTIGNYETEEMDLAYFMYFFTMSWLLPLTVMVYCYIRIIMTVWTRATNPTLQTSVNTSIEKAKVKTIKMTGTLVLGFILCWSPYNIMALWFRFDPESANSVDFRVQKLLWVFASANNCFNPILYGIFGYGSTRKSGRPRAITETGIVRSPVTLARKTLNETELTPRIKSYSKSGSSSKPGSSTKTGSNPETGTRKISQTSVSFGTCNSTFISHPSRAESSPPRGNRFKCVKKHSVRVQYTNTKFYVQSGKGTYAETDNL